MALTKVIGDGLGGTNDLTVDTDTLIVDSTNDKVGINVASPNNYYSKELVVGVPDNGGITILNSDTTHAGCIMFADGTGTSAYRGQIVYDHNDDSIGMWTAATNAMKIDSTGAMTKPLQPAFYAETASSQSNIALNTAQTLAFGGEIFDQNADFASNTFTAPLSGRYFLHTTLRFEAIDTAATYILWGIVTSNRQFYSILDPQRFSADVNYYSVQQTVLADMDASDTAHVVFLQSGGTQQTDLQGADGYSYFCGHLVA
tara:strand:+ start:9 stop:782 length:774 start_codon:yes stop_codon:yes gene_type:complete